MSGRGRKISGNLPSASGRAQKPKHKSPGPNRTAPGAVSPRCWNWPTVRFSTCTRPSKNFLAPRQARRQIVVTTLRFLEDLSKDAGQDDDLRFVLSASYFKVANVLGYPAQPNLGDTKGALANYEKSAGLLEPLLAKDPNRPEYLLQWVQTKVHWATLLARTDEKPRAVQMMRRDAAGGSTARAVASPGPPMPVSRRARCTR